MNEYSPCYLWRNLILDLSALGKLNGTGFSRCLCSLFKNYKCGQKKGGGYVLTPDDEEQELTCH